MIDPGRRDNRWLLVSDIDDTLTGDDAALEKLGTALERYRDRLWFAVNSSRPSESVAETLRDMFPRKLVPDACITAMGTEVSIDGVFQTDWQMRFDGWPHAQIFETLKSLGHEPHDPIYQTPLKVSFAVSGQAAQAEARNALADAELDCQIITSGTDDFDILPPGAGKGHATKYLAKRLGADMAHVIAAGDSGNDVALLMAAAHRIVVGNARPELLTALPPGQFYHAKQAHAAGVLEGLEHFDILPPHNDNMKHQTTEFEGK